MNLDQLDWQTVVALTIVGVAIGILIRKSWKTLFGPSSGCGTSCNSCPSSTSTDRRNSIKATELIQIED